MSIINSRLEGTYYDGKRSIAKAALLVFDGTEITLTSGDLTLTYTLHNLHVSPRVGSSDRFITFSDGGQYQCIDQPILDKLPLDVKSEGIVAWLEERISIAVTSVVIIICALLFGYLYGMPLVAESIIKRIPIETETSLGNHVLTWFDDSKWFNESHIDQDLQDSITNRFNKLHEELSMSSYIKLKYRCSERIGPNAFALPGGIIVITDQMVKMSESEDEVLAILAHEIGHAEKRHSIRQVLQGSFIALAATTITADAASLSAAVTGLPVILARTKYSRDFESEADDFAFDLLKQNDILPEAFASIMERLDKDRASKKRLSFLSTHPVTDERIKRARKSSKQTNETDQENTHQKKEPHKNQNINEISTNTIVKNKYFQEKIEKMFTFDDWFRKGRTEFDNKEYTDSVESFTYALEKKPESANAYSWRGHIYSHLMQYEKAIEDFNKAIELDPKYTKAYYWRGTVYHNLNQYEKAIENFNKAIELDPKYADAYCWRGCALSNLNQYEKAIEDFNKAIELNPIYADAYYWRGCAFSNLNQYEKAIENLNKAIELDPKSENAYYWRGCAYTNLKKYEKAIMDFNKTIGLEPKFENINYWRGIAYCNLNQYEKAIEDFNKAIELDPKSENAYYWRGHAYLDLKQYEIAIENFNKSIELNPKYENVYGWRGYTYRKLKQYEKAIEDFNKEIELDPKFAHAYNGRGYSYYLNKQYEKAIEDYNKVIELDPKSAYAYSWRGYMYYVNKQFEQAIKDYSKAIELDPEDYHPYKNLAELNIVLGNCESALGNIKKALSLQPKVQHKAIILHHEFIAKKVIGMDTAKCEADFNEVIKKDFVHSWDFEALESWFKDAEIEEETKKLIKRNTELLKKHQE